MELGRTLVYLPDSRGVLCPAMELFFNDANWMSESLEGRSAPELPAKTLGLTRSKLKATRKRLRSAIAIAAKERWNEAARRRRLLAKTLSGWREQSVQMQKARLV